MLRLRSKLLHRLEAILTSNELKRIDASQMKGYRRILHIPLHLLTDLAQAE